MGEYINTGKKVKRICDGLDLTRDKVYDVFNDGAIEFIIDDAGDWRYADQGNFDFHNRYELVDDTVNTDNTTVETNHKFKEGDKVMVVNTDYISAYDAGVRVGDIGTVIESGVDKYHVKFEGTGYDCDWFFTDNCIELVNDDVNTTNETKPKFRVGDKVKVVDIEYISQATSDIKVGNVGVIAYVDSDYVMSPYRVEFADDNWWFNTCFTLILYYAFICKRRVP